MFLIIILTLFPIPIFAHDRYLEVEQSAKAFVTYQEEAKNSPYQAAESTALNNEEKDFLKNLTFSLDFDPETFYYQRSEFLKKYSFQKEWRNSQFFNHYGLWDTDFLLLIVHHQEKNWWQIFYHKSEDEGVKSFLNQLSLDKQNKIYIDLLSKIEAYKKLGGEKNQFFVPDENFRGDFLVFPPFLDNLKKEIPILRLGTASKRGMYYHFGKLLEEKLSGKIIVDVKSTEGSIDNLIKGSEGELDAYMAQSDSFRVFLKNHPDKKFFIPVERIYEEYMHIITRRDSGIKKITDLISDDALSYNVFVGDKNSGGFYTWQGIILQNKAYEKVPIEYLSGVDALRKILENKYRLLLFVGGPQAPFLQTVEKFGSDLRLVEVNDALLESAEDSFGQSIYHLGKIPRDTYPTLQKGLFFNSSVRTLTVGATFCVSSEWQKKFGRGNFQLLIDSIKSLH